MAFLENGNILETDSKGLLGLSHFRNSRVSTSLWEPIYQNQFSVMLVPPYGMQGDTDDNRVNTILEGVQSVGQIPSSKGSGVVEQKYKFANRSFAGAVPENTILDLQITFALNLQYPADRNTGGFQPTNYTYNFLREWCDLIYDPLTGRQGLKRDYVAPSMTITMHDRAGTPYWQWICYAIFPTNGAGGPTLSYMSNDLMQVQMTFRCDWWDECSM